MHRLTRATDPGSVRYIALYPSSFAPFISSDLNLGNSYTHEAFSGIPIPQTAILIPKPPAVFTSILRLLTRYPRDSATRSALLADLSQLIMYYLYKMDGFIDESGSSDDDDDTVANAVRVVRSWRLGFEWKQDEEWIGEALEAVVSGAGRIEFLPWMPQVICADAITQT